jgi:hypothetical protein
MSRSEFQRLIVFGCSLTKDNHIDTWADFLSEELKLNLTNLAERGAGHEYIVQKVLSTDFLPDDLVVIMWPSADRFDLYVNDATPHLQNDLEYASWLNGKEPRFVDYHGVYNDHTGWYLNGAVPRGHKHIYYKYFYNQTTHMNRAWSSIVMLQNFLQNKKIKYVMCNSYKLKNMIQYHDDDTPDFNHKLYQNINLDQFVAEAEHTGFMELVTDQGFKFFNAHHPDSEAHQWYVENYIKPKILSCN